MYLDQKREYVNLGDLSDKYFSNKGLFKKVYQYRDSNKPYDIKVASGYFTSDELELLEKSIDQVKNIANYPSYYTEMRRQFYEIDLQKQIQSKQVNPDMVQQYIDLMKSGGMKEKVFNFKEDLFDYLDRFGERVVGKFERYGLGLRGFDDILGYVRPKRFYVIGASPGVGKTNLMLEMDLFQKSKDVPCLFITAEMGYDDLIERMGSINSGLRLFDILNAHLKPEHVKSYTDSIQSHLYGKKSYVFETPRFSIPKIKQLIDKMGVKFIFVDYLQKFSLETKRNETRASVMSDIATGLKEISMEKNVIVFAGSQLDKNADRKNAQLSNLKESGGIEENADGIFLLSEIAFDENFKKIKVDIAKNKYGICDQFMMTMDRKTCHMEYSDVDTVNLKESPTPTTKPKWENKND